MSADMLKAGVEIIVRTWIEIFEKKKEIPSYRRKKTLVRATNGEGFFFYLSLAKSSVWLFLTQFSHPVSH